MNKVFILHAIEKRITELKEVYKSTIKQVGVIGQDLSYGSSRVVRCNTKRDLQTCCLVYQLALCMDDDAEITDEDAVAGMLRLIEPKQRR